MSLIARQHPARRLDRDRRQQHLLEVALERAREAVLGEVLGLDRRRGSRPRRSSPRRPARACARTRRSPRRIVPSPPSTTHSSTSALGSASQTIPALRAQPELARLVAVEAQQDAGGARLGDQLLERGGDLLRAAVREHRGGAAPASRLHHPRGRVEVGDVAGRARPRRATRSSRGCPSGPAAPTRRSRAPRAPSSRAARRDRDERTRAARPARARRRPCRRCPRPTSNCGLIIASTSWRGATHASTAGRTFVSEMNDRSTTTRSGAYGSASALDAHARWSARAPSRARRCAAASRARRRRRRARPRAPRRAAAGSR